MVKLSRISLEEIGGLIDGDNLSDKVSSIGRGSIRGSRWKKNCLIISSPGEYIKINVDRNIMTASRADFLKAVDGYLTKNKRYLTNVVFSTQKGAGFFPHKVKGLFYEEN